MKKLFFTLSILLFLISCDMELHQSGADPEPKQSDGISYGDSLALRILPGTGNTESFVFLFRVPASDPDGDRLKFAIVEQPVKGMFSINDLGDMYITKSYLDKIQNWYGKKLEVVVSVSDGVNISKATMTFIVDKSPDGRHYLKRNIA